MYVTLYTILNGKISKVTIYIKLYTKTLYWWHSGTHKTILLGITQGKNQANYIHFHYVTQDLNNIYCMFIAIEEKIYIIIQLNSSLMIHFYLLCVVPKTKLSFNLEFYIFKHLLNLKTQAALYIWSKTLSIQNIIPKTCVIFCQIFTLSYEFSTRQEVKGTAMPPYKGEVIKFTSHTLHVHSTISILSPWQL